MIPGLHIHITTLPAAKFMPAASPPCAQHMNRELIILCPHCRSAPAAVQSQPWFIRRESTLSTTVVCSSAYPRLQMQTQNSKHTVKQICIKKKHSCSLNHQGRCISSRKQHCLYPICIYFQGQVPFQLSI